MITYVSCFVNINCKEPHKTHQWRMENFLHIAHTGVPFVLYVDQEIREAYKDTWPKLPNVALREVDYANSWTYKACAQYKDKLPASRNQVKDSFLFLCLMNMKIEFVVSAVNENPFGTQHFAWVDFNLAHIFKDKTGTSNWMKFLATRNWNSRFIANPGCWEKGQGMESIVDNINWRFCGGFMIGDGESFNDLFDLYLVHFTSFLHKYRHITWEVNFWAWLEVNANWKIIWYKADHDDSIVKVPSRLFARSILDASINIMMESTTNSKSRYISLNNQLPQKPGYYPMSSSYIEYEERHILNVRYINYQLDPHGRYIIHHPAGHLHTLNLRCYLSDDLTQIASSEFMWEDMLQMKEYDESIKGLEDVRLYVDYANKLKYVATNKSFNPGNKIRIMTGDYNDTMAMFETGTILEPPTDTGCEKNWIPTLNNDFIYKWSPYELGKVENGQLIIVKTLDIGLPRNIRGSTVPVQLDDGSYMCVVHYCEHGPGGLEYYHMLLKLNAEYEPVAWSDVFYFNKIGIQYCIGFTVKNNNMYFWFSEHDANPGLIIKTRD